MIVAQPSLLPMALQLPPANAWCQRWRERRLRWRHQAAGAFAPRRYEVAALDEARARAFVERHHYSGAYVAARYRFGLFEGAELVGVAVLSVPTRAEVLSGPFPDLAPYWESLELGRFVLLDEVPGNGESWFLARVFRMALREGIRGIVSFSDPLARQDRSGRLVFPGHIGTIYQTVNAIYAGRSAPRTLHLLPDGRVLNARSLAKMRALDRGYRSVERLLCAFGALPRAGQEPAVWLAGALPAAGVRAVRHPGNHRYLFPLGHRPVRIAITALPYPKRHLPA